MDATDTSEEAATDGKEKKTKGKKQKKPRVKKEKRTKLAKNAIVLDDVLFSGRAYRYKAKQAFNPAHWKECWMVLYKEGELRWYSDKQCRRLMPESFNIAQRPDRLRIGIEAANNKSAEFPTSPYSDYSLSRLISLGLSGGKKKKKKRKDKETALQWFYFKSENDMARWTKAFATVIGKRRAFEDFVHFIESSTGRYTPTTVSQKSSENSTADEPNEIEMDDGESSDARQLVQHHPPTVDFGQIWRELLTQPNDDQDASHHGHHHHDQVSLRRQVIDEEERDLVVAPPATNQLRRPVSESDDEYNAEVELSPPPYATILPKTADGRQVMTTAVEVYPMDPPLEILLRRPTGDAEGGRSGFTNNAYEQHDDEGDVSSRM